MRAVDLAGGAKPRVHERSVCVDSGLIVLAATIRMLVELEAELQVIVEAGLLQELLPLLKRLSPHFFLLDVL
jgi:hypothetical protein